MGNLLSVQQQSNDDRIHICDRCGFWTRHRATLRTHKARLCRINVDGRFRSGTSAITVSATQGPHVHDDSGACSGCADEHAADEHAADEYATEADNEQLRDAVNDQLRQYMQDTGDDLPPDMFAALSDLLVGIVGNGEI